MSPDTEHLVLTAEEGDWEIWCTDQPGESVSDNERADEEGTLATEMLPRFILRSPSGQQGEIPLDQPTLTLQEFRDRLTVILGNPTAVQIVIDRFGIAESPPGIVPPRCFELQPEP